MILNKIPTEYFLTPATQPTTKIGDADRPLLTYRDTRRVTILVQRTVIGPFVNRHNLEEETITVQVAGAPHIRIPNRKLKSVEKNRVLRAARMAGLVHPEYLNNEVQEVEHLGNPVSIVYGDGSNKTNEVAGIPSRVMHSQAISVQPKAGAITSLTHNALSDEGTMRNVLERKDGRATMRTSLYETHYVKEGTTFLSTVTIDTPTAEVLAVVLYGLQAGSYGAGTNVYGTNIRNDILGIAFTQHELPMTPWSVLNDSPTDNVEKAVELFCRVAEEASKGGTYLGTMDARALQAEMAGDRKNVARDLAILQEQSIAYVDTVFGKRA